MLTFQSHFKFNKIQSLFLNSCSNKSVFIHLLSWMRYYCDMIAGTGNYFLIAQPFIADCKKRHFVIAASAGSWRGNPRIRETPRIRRIKRIKTDQSRTTQSKEQISRERDEQNQSVALSVWIRSIRRIRGSTLPVVRHNEAVKFRSRATSRKENDRQNDRRTFAPRRYVA